MSTNILAGVLEHAAKIANSTWIGDSIQLPNIQVVHSSIDTEIHDMNEHTYTIVGPSREYDAFGVLLCPNNHLVSIVKRDSRVLVVYNADQTKLEIDLDSLTEEEFFQYSTVLDLGTTYENLCTLRDFSRTFKQYNLAFINVIHHERFNEDILQEFKELHNTIIGA